MIMKENHKEEQSLGYGERLKEMTAVLHKYGVTRGVTPEKLRLILEELGPYLYQAGTDHVHALGYSPQGGIAMN